MKKWHCCILYLIQVPIPTVYKHKVQKYFWSTPLTRISIDVADSSLLPLLFVSSLSILSGCPIINICGGHQDMKLWWIWPMAYHPHTGFYYPKLLTYLSHDFCSFSNISGMDLNGSGYRQILIWLCVKNILAKKSKCSGCMLASGWLTVSLRSCNRLNIIMCWKGQIQKLELSGT